MMIEDKSMLIVEDDEMFCASMVDALTKEGYSPLSAHTLREANFKIRNQKFRCIVLDMHLGEDRGTEIIQLLRVHKQTPNAETPIVVISGFLELELVRTIAAHIQGALVKPFGPEQLLERIRNIF